MQSINTEVCTVNSIKGEFGQTVFIKTKNRKYVLNSFLSPPPDLSYFSPHFLLFLASYIFNGSEKNRKKAFTSTSQRNIPVPPHPHLQSLVIKNKRKKENGRLK